MSRAPEPLVPAYVDLRDFAFMPLDVVRLRDSDLSATPDGEVFRAAVLAWCVSWHQVPASSLPDDDQVLARVLGYGRDLATWALLRADGALRGFIKCSDGRLYHPVVAEKANSAWQSKEAQRNRTKKAREARQSHSMSQPLSQNDAASVTETATEPVTASKGQGEGYGQGERTPLTSFAERAREEIDLEFTESTKFLDKRKPSQATSLPENYPDDEAMRRAIGFWNERHRPDLAHSVRDQAEQFRAHHTAKGTRSKSWAASWRTWIGNALEFNRDKNRERTNASVKDIRGAVRLALGQDGPTEEDEPVTIGAGSTRTPRLAHHNGADAGDQGAGDPAIGETGRGVPIGRDDAA